MISALLRFLMPFVLFYLFLKFLKHLLILGWKERQTLNKRTWQPQSKSHEQRDTIIDICPQCGEVVTPRHHCK